MKFTTLLAFPIVLMMISHIAAASTMRCGTHIIQVGDTKIEVLKHCGEPDLTDLISGLEDIKTEIWYYDRGSTGFLYIVTMRGSKVSRIEVKQS